MGRVVGRVAVGRVVGMVAVGRLSGRDNEVYRQHPPPLPPSPFPFPLPLPLPLRPPSPKVPTPHCTPTPNPQNFTIFRIFPPSHYMSSPVPSFMSPLAPLPTIAAPTPP